jgi:hypothetical protein
MPVHIGGRVGGRTLTAEEERRRLERRLRLEERRNLADAGLDLVEAVAEGRLDHLHHLLAAGHSPNVRVPLPDRPETEATGDRAAAEAGASHEGGGDAACGTGDAKAGEKGGAERSEMLEHKPFLRGEEEKEEEEEQEQEERNALPSRPPHFPSRRMASPLWLAASLGHLDIVQALAEHGADLNAADDEGTTPFVAACEAGHDAVVRWLKDHARVGCTTVRAARAALAAEAAAREGAQRLARERKAARSARSARDLLKKGDGGVDGGGGGGAAANPPPQAGDALAAKLLLPGVAEVAADSSEDDGGGEGGGGGIPPSSPRYAHHSAVDESATPAGYEGVCLWQQRPHDGRGALWHAASNGCLAIVKHLLRHAEPVRAAEKAALEAALASAHEKVELGEKAQRAEALCEAASEKAAELRGQEGENRAAAADCKAQAGKQHATSCLQLMNAAMLVKQALEEKELRLSEDQTAQLMLLLPERFRDDDDDEGGDDDEEEEEEEDDDDEDDEDDDEDGEGGDDSSSKSGSDSGSGSSSEDEGPVVDRPEEWIGREERPTAVELIREIEGVAKQYGAPVAKDIGTMCSVARRAGVACVAAEKQEIEFAALAEGCVAPREEQEKIAEDSGRRAQALSRQVQEAEELEQKYEKRREIADAQLELADAELRVEVLEPSNRGVTPFAAACAAGRLDAVAFLARPPPMCPVSELQRPDRGGRTPFYMACRGGHLPVVQLLKEADVDVYVADSCGVSPFAAAVKAGRLQLCIYLKLQDVELTAVDALTEEYYPGPAKRWTELLAGMRELQLHEMDWFKTDCLELKERLRQLRKKK